MQGPRIYEGRVGGINHVLGQDQSKGTVHLGIIKQLDVDAAEHATHNELVQSKLLSARQIVTEIIEQL
jgi:hypothetical protein